MYQHHKESLEIMKQYFQEKEECIALIFGGSVAKGMERPDSDLDGMVVISQENYEKRMEQRMLSETITGKCTYEGGYFDIKYLTKEYLKEAAKKGSEPTRNAFIGARVLFSSDPEIEKIVNQIPVFQKQEKEDKMLSFYSALSLNYHYFLKDCKPEGYMKSHVTSEIIYCVYRMILQENEIIFPSNRRLEETVEKAQRRPENIVGLGKAYAASQSEEDADAFVKAFLDWTSYQEPADLSEVLTRYQEDYETWWIKPRPLVNEW